MAASRRPLISPFNRLTEVSFPPHADILVIQCARISNSYGTLFLLPATVFANFNFGNGAAFGGTLGVMNAMAESTIFTGSQSGPNNTVQIATPITTMFGLNPYTQKALRQALVWTVANAFESGLNQVSPLSGLTNWNGNSRGFIFVNLTLLRRIAAANHVTFDINFTTATAGSGSINCASTMQVWTEAIIKAKAMDYISLASLGGLTPQNAQQMGFPQADNMQSWCKGKISGGPVGGTLGTCAAKITATVQLNDNYTTTMTGTIVPSAGSSGENSFSVTSGQGKDF